MPRFAARALGTGMVVVGVILGLVQTHAAVIVGPWLEGDTTTNVDVLVECDSAAAMTVNYGATTNYGMSATTSVCWTNTNAAADFIHRITLTGLQTNALYHYQLAGQGASGADYTFCTYLAGTAIALAEAPQTVRTAAATVAAGRAIEKMETVSAFEGPEFRAYIAGPLGPQLLTLDGNGQTLDYAEIVPFAGLPPAVRASAPTAVAGRLQVCRKSLQRVPTAYVIDYIINEKEPVFAVILEADGLVRASYGYNQDDGDDDDN